MSVPTLRFRFNPDTPRLRARVYPAIPPLQPSFRNNGTYIQWRVGESGAWTNLVALTDIVGPVASVVAGSGIDVDVTDVVNPVVSVETNLQEWNTVNPSTDGKSLVAAEDYAAMRELLVVIPHLGTRAAIKALDTTKDTIAFLTESGREGIFNWTTGDFSTLVTTDSEEGIYLESDDVAATTGAWVREFSGQASIAWFGAVDDGATNILDAFQCAVNVHPDVQVPGTSGSWLLDGTVEITSPVRVSGDASTSLIKREGTDHGFSIQSSDVVFDGLLFDGADLGGSCYDFLLATSVGHLKRIRISNVRTTSSRGFVVDENHASNTIEDLLLSNVYSRLHKGRHTYLRDGIAFIRMQDVYAELIHNGTAQNFVAYEINNVEGAFLDRVEATGSQDVDTGTSSSQNGFIFRDAAAVHLHSAFADNFGGLGFIFQNTAFIHLSEIVASINMGGGILFENCSKVVGSVIYQRGRNDLAGSAGIQGILTTSACSDITLSSVETSYNTGNGAYNFSGTNVLINGLLSHNNTAYGWAADQGSTDSLVVGARLHDNTAGDYVIAGDNRIGPVQRHDKSVSIPGFFNGANASGPASVDLHEDTDNGTNYGRLAAPSAITSNRAWTLPDADMTFSTFMAGLMASASAAALQTAAGVREVLTAARTYYVRTDGSDSNNGLADTSGGAFLTLQKAINVVAALDISIYTVTIQVGAGTYTAGVSVTGPWVGTGTVHLVGDTTTPSNVVISTTSAGAVAVTSGGRLTVRGFKIQTTTSGIGVAATNGGRISLNGLMEYGACATYQLYAANGGAVSTSSNYTISGGSTNHAVTVDQGLIFSASNTITLTGTPAFSGAFVDASRMGLIDMFLNTFSGSATGVRYLAATGGGVNSLGGGATYYPGDAGGTATAPGWYN